MAEVIFVGGNFNPFRLAGTSVISVQTKTCVEQTGIGLTLSDGLKRNRTTRIGHDESVKVNVFAFGSENILTVDNVCVSWEYVVDVWVGDWIAVLNGRLRQFVGIAQAQQNTDPSHKRSEKLRAKEVVVGGIKLLAIDHHSRLAGVGQKRACCVGDVIAGLVGRNGSQCRQRVDDLHIANGDREALVVAFDKSHTDVFFVERDNLPRHRLLDLGDRIELYAGIGSPELRGKVVIDDFDAIGVRAGDVMLVAIVAITCFAVGTWEVQCVRGRVLDLRANNRCLSTWTCQPTSTQIHRRAKSTSWIACGSNRGNGSVVDRVIVADAKTQ